MTGVVVKSTGSLYSVLSETGEYYFCKIKGKFRIQGIKSTNPVAVGDKVDFDTESGEEKVGIITNIHSRKNYIIRKSINLSKQTHILAANIDRAFLVVTLIFPRTSTGFIDRFLVTAEAYGVPVTLIFNKSDLLDDDLRALQKDIMENYTRIGYSCMEISALKIEDVLGLKNIMEGKINLLSGHSGVGKSTLINALEPKLNVRTGDLSKAHFKGMHTTTFAEMLPLSNGGFIIDTPGIKELGLTDMNKDELGDYFPEIRSRMNGCRFNDCRHINEPGCAVKEAVEAGEISESRYMSYWSMYHSEETDSEF
jgi:ribosome biogenesis GTPase / thiamine phosphate phosphatase